MATISVCFSAVRSNTPASVTPGDIEVSVLDGTDGVTVIQSRKIVPDDANLPFAAEAVNFDVVFANIPNGAYFVKVRNLDASGAQFGSVYSQAVVVNTPQPTYYAVAPGMTVEVLP